MPSPEHQFGSSSLKPDSILAGKYRIEREIARGGLANVYLASELPANRQVAIKVLRLPDDRSKAMLIREARLFAKLIHPNLIATYEVGVDNGITYLVSEYVAGDSLEHLQRGSPPPRLSTLCQIYKDIASALAYLHHQGLVHRDLKPQNILVTVHEDQAPIVKILDFGLAVSTNEPDPYTKVSTTWVGTLPYTSPEQVVGKKVDARSDIFALGSMLYEAFVGVSPWSGHEARSQDPYSIAKAVIQGLTDEHIKQLTSLAPRSLGKLITRMLALDSATRPDAEKVATELTTLCPEIPKDVVARISAEPIGHPNLKHTGLGDLRSDAMPKSSLSLPTLLVVFVLVLLAIALVLTFSSGISFPQESTHILISGLGLVIGLSALTASIIAHRREPVRRTDDILDPNTERRLFAMEQRLSQLKSASESVLMDLGEIRSKFEGSDLKALIYESVVAAISDLQLESGESDPKHVADKLSRFRKKRRSEVPWHKRASVWLGIAGTIITVGAGAVGLMGDLRLWTPNQAPVIEALGPVNMRASLYRPTEITVQARDPDGDALEYTYSASSGQIRSNGPLALWEAEQGTTDEILKITVTVSDGIESRSKYRAFRVNRLPVLSIRVEPVPRTRGVFRLYAPDKDPDGDSLSYTWHTSCGELAPSNQATVVLTVSNDTCAPTISTKIDDGWDITRTETVIPQLFHE